MVCGGELVFITMADTRDAPELEFAMHSGTTHARKAKTNRAKTKTEQKTIATLMVHSPTVRVNTMLECVSERVSE